MKQKLFFLFLNLFITFISFAQVPQAIPYQGVARDAAGNVLASRNIGLRFKIHDAVAAGTIVYSETQTVATNSIGTFTANIGLGTVVSGSFAGIDWSAASKYIQVEMDINGGTAYVDMGTKQMLSVPYALSSPGSNYFISKGDSLQVSPTYKKLKLGTNTIASGEYATAMGIGAIASGAASTAMGSSTTASGNFSTAMGYYTTASGIRSSAMGSETSASGDISTAMGNYSRAKGNTSTAMGFNTTALGISSTAMGNSTTASGVNATAMGRYTLASGDTSTAMGYNTIASGNTSTSMGYYTTASGITSTAMGYQTTASGITSTAIGFITEASGNQSTAMGSFTTASGENSTAMGYGTAASGIRSTAMGLSTEASGDYSTAMGSGTTASGDYSTAMGSGTTASGLVSTAIGYSTTASGNQSTAMGSKVNTNGYVGTFMIGDADPDNTGSTTGGIANQFVARFKNGYFLMSSNNNVRTGVKLSAGDNAWSAISDSNRKEKMLPVDGESLLKKISGFRLCTWNYKGQDPKTFRHYGPMAQDFHNAFGHDAYGTIGNDSLINQSDFLGVSFNAIQALEKRTQKISDLESELDAMKKENEALKKENITFRKELDEIKEMLKGKINPNVFQDRDSK